MVGQEEKQDNQEEEEKKGPHFLVNGVRECFSYRQCRRYLTQRLHVGMALLHLDFLRRHSLQAWSAKPRGMSRSPRPAPRLRVRSAEAKPALPSARLASADDEGLSSMVIGSVGAMVRRVWTVDEDTKTEQECGEGASSPSWARVGECDTFVGGNKSWTLATLVTLGLTMCGPPPAVASKVPPGRAFARRCRLASL